MNPAQYTDEAICRSMGLAAFVEPAWSPPTLRLLLKPSFDPEVCATLIAPAESARLSAVVLAEMLWRQPFPRVLPAWREQAALSATVFAGIAARFASALAADRQPEDRVVCLDGMPVAACLLSSTGLEQFGCSPYRREVSAFVSSLVRVAWESCRTPWVREGLAACGRYVGLDFPREPVPPAPQRLRMAVLGTPDARADFFGRLQSRG
jgi:hypothetical protein